MRYEEYITDKKKKVSAAVLMSDGNRFLVTHLTGNPKNVWELPKGNIEDGENEKQAAVREFYEETGIKINLSKLRKVGKFPLHSTKDIVLFTYSTDNLPVTASMRCLSTFHPYNSIGDYETTLPETDNWMYITPDEINKYVRSDMRNMIRKAL